MEKDILFQDKKTGQIYSFSTAELCEGIYLLKCSSTLQNKIFKLVKLN